MRILKTSLRAIVLTGVGAGVLTAGTVLVAGPDRAHAVFEQVQDTVHTTIDKNIDDPVALRNQLRRLEKQYPARITQVSGDLAELRQEILGLERELQISEKVVAMTAADLGNNGEVAANNGYVLEPGNGAVRTASSMRPLATRVSTQVRHAQRTHDLYAGRAADLSHDLGYLRQQEGRLQELLVTLEAERSEFQVQLATLNRQVEAIARNERLIEMLEKREKTIKECSRYEAVSLDQVSGTLATLRSRQEAELSQLTASQTEMDYEDLARQEVRAQAYTVSSECQSASSCDL